MHDNTLLFVYERWDHFIISELCLCSNRTSLASVFSCDAKPSVLQIRWPGAKRYQWGPHTFWRCRRDHQGNEEEKANLLFHSTLIQQMPLSKGWQGYLSGATWESWDEAEQATPWTQLQSGLQVRARRCSSQASSLCCDGYCPSDTNRRASRTKGITWKFAMSTCVEETVATSEQYSTCGVRFIHNSTHDCGKIGRKFGL